MAYQFPDSSSNPTTPDKRGNNGNHAFSFNGPSTTPAGPPPSSAGSFTPAGHPTSSFLGSSGMDTGSPLKPLSFSQQSAFGQSSASYMQSSLPPMRSGLSNMYQPESNNDFGSSRFDVEGEEVEYMEEDEGDYEQEQSYDEDADAMTDEEPHYPEDEDDQMDDTQFGISEPRRNGLGHSQNTDLLQSKEGDTPGFGNSYSQSTSRKKKLAFGEIAKDIYSRMPAAPSTESDDVILETEAKIAELYEQGINDDALQDALQVIPSELVDIWDHYNRKTIGFHEEEYKPTIGPSPKDSNFSKANFLAGLALQIYQPSQHRSRIGHMRIIPLPQILLEWMDEHHNPYPSQFEQIQAYRPSPASHPEFWNTLFDCLLRGKVVAVVNSLKDAGWRYATGGKGDSSNRVDQGFTGIALENINKVVGVATSVLSKCPAADGDWHTGDDDWSIFRGSVENALEDLKTFAEGRDRVKVKSLIKTGSLSKSDAEYSKTAKRAESKVPWHIYQNLVTLYKLILGDVDVIRGIAQDWCEATIGILVWRDGNRKERRQALGRSQRNIQDIDPKAAAEKLSNAFQLVFATTTDFHVDAANPVEVGLASLFEGNIEALVGLLRGWSGPLSSAIAEVSTLGGWLPKPEEKNLIAIESLSQEDLTLLNYNSSPSKTDSVKDQTLIVYARSLTRRAQLKSSGKLGQPQVGREGWEIAISVLGRLESATRSEEMIGEFLKGLSPDDSTTVDKLWRLLNDLGMNKHAEKTAESYADFLAEDSHNYGEALWYYALAHNNAKVKDVLDLLISFSLVQSTAYPPEKELDQHLRRLISSPKSALTEMSRMDLEAAELIQKMLSGYATLRRFYNLRDHEVLPQQGSKAKRGAITSKIEAASALIAVITSSDDNIRGGLYDEKRGAVVSVDFLLALLGEAMVFVNQPDYIMPVGQIETLLKAIEDLQTVGPRVYSACTEFLQTVVASGQGLSGSTPTDMLRKSTSNVSGTSSFSMVGSSMLASQLKQSMSSSGVLVKGNTKRGWDWRNGITAGTTGDDLLRILRLGLAQGLAKAWLLEADNAL